MAGKRAGDGTTDRSAGTVDDGVLALQQHLSSSLLSLPMSAAAAGSGELAFFALACVAGRRTTPVVAFSLTRTSGQITWVIIVRISITSATHRSCRMM